MPIAKDRPIILEAICDIASTFQMSRTATAIKLVRRGSFPAILVYYESGTRKWFIRPKGVPSALFPATRPDENTLTGSLFYNPSAEDGTDVTRADYWFEHPKANRYYLRESCFRTSPDSLVTLLSWDDETQIIDLEEEEERNAARRSDEGWRRC